MQNEPLDTKQHTLSSISTTDGEIPYDEWVFVETSGKRILTDEGDITYVLQLLQNVGNSWANNGIVFSFGDNQYLRFDSKSSLVSFLEIQIESLNMIYSRKEGLALQVMYLKAAMGTQTETLE
ncbi:hypothetical protein CJ738_31240 [Klebsiella pneumoniae]|nr:hypothetical protein CJ738_31240 [Klebsiella pneumoniae]